MKLLLSLLFYTIFTHCINLNNNKIIFNRNIVKGLHVICGNYTISSEFRNNTGTINGEHKLLVIIISLQREPNYNLTLTALTNPKTTKQNEKLKIEQIESIYSTLSINHAKYFIFNLSLDELKKIITGENNEEFINLSPKHIRALIFKHHEWNLEKRLDNYDDISFLLNGTTLFNSNGFLMKGFTRISCNGDIIFHIEGGEVGPLQKMDLFVNLEMNIFASLSVSEENEYEIHENKSIFKFNVNSKRNKRKFAVYSESSPSQDFAYMFYKLWSFGDKYKKKLTESN